MKPVVSKEIQNRCRNRRLRRVPDQKIPDKRRRKCKRKTSRTETQSRNRKKSQENET